jgi:endonuclease YncB( thermonuclease family)
LRVAALLFGVSLWALSAPAVSGCPSPAPGAAEVVHLAYVIDGDTVILEGGERVRLIGIDTPELGHEGASDQPLAAEAAQVLRELAGPRGARLRIQPGADPRDRHGRRLAHLFGADGRHLAEQVLRRGLGYVAAVPPNLRYIDCLQAAQGAARREGLGLWRSPALDAAHLPARAGFMRVRGRVARVHGSRQGLWIELAGGLGLQVQDADRPVFQPLGLDALPGREVEVLGWVYRAKGGARMRLRHPSALMADPPPR